MQYDTALYMFAIVPPANLADKLNDVRNEFSSQFGFYQALKPPVHITLLKPFKIPSAISGAFERYISRIQDWAGGQLPFRVDLCNYNFFDNTHHPVVYIEVQKSEQVNAFHNSFTKELISYRLTKRASRSYIPHITVGYRDVTPAAFPAIRRHYTRQLFSHSFICQSFCLWKHDGKRWQEVRKFFLGAQKEQLALFG